MQKGLGVATSSGSKEGFEVLLVKLKENWKAIYQEMLSFIKYWIWQ